MEYWLYIYNDKDEASFQKLDPSFLKIFEKGMIFLFFELSVREFNTD